MKKAILRWLLFAAVLALTISGCDMLGVGVQDRVTMFLGDLNSSDRGDIYLNFHPTLTTDYPAIQNGTYPDWSTLFPIGTYIPYSISNLDTSDPGNVTGDIDSVNGAWAGPKAIVFRMAQEGLDWMIQEMDLDAANIIN
jgi:hypothetical protein